jgi:hypothetical protein
MGECMLPNILPRRRGDRRALVKFHIPQRGWRKTQIQTNCHMTQNREKTREKTREKITYRERFIQVIANKGCGGRVIQLKQLVRI